MRKIAALVAGSLVLGSCSSIRDTAKDLKELVGTSNVSIVKVDRGLATLEQALSLLPDNKGAELIAKITKVRGVLLEAAAKGGDPNALDGLSEWIRLLAGLLATIRDVAR